MPTEVDGKTSNLINLTDPTVTIGPLFKNPTAKSFSPRVGAVWAPGEGRMSIRGGFGIFYEHPMLYNIRTALQELPPFTLVGRIDGTGVNFPNAFTTQLNRAGARPNIRTMQYDLDQTTYYRWSVTLQRQFWTNWVASADYTGSRGYNLWQQSLPNINKWQGWPEQPTGDKFFPPGSTLINPNFGETRIQYSNAHLWYKGVSFALQRRLSAGLQFGAALTLSETIDEGSGVTSGGDELPQTQRGIYAWDMHLKKGPAAYDIPKVFTGNVSYELPFGRNLTGLAGGAGERLADQQHHLADGRLSAVGRRGERRAGDANRRRREPAARPDPRRQSQPRDRGSGALVRRLAVHPCPARILRQSSPGHRAVAGSGHG